MSIHSLLRISATSLITFICIFSNLSWADLYIWTAGEISALDEDTGDVKWSHNHNFNKAASQSSLDYDETLYIMERPSHTLYAINMGDEKPYSSLTERMKWHTVITKPTDITYTSRSVCYTSPIMTRSHQILLSCHFHHSSDSVLYNNVFYSIEKKDGSNLEYFHQAGNHLFGTPSIDANSNIYLSYGASLIQLPLSNISKKSWSFSFNKFPLHEFGEVSEPTPLFEPPLISDQSAMIHVLKRDSLWGITKGGSFKWRFSESINTLAVGKNGNVFVGTGEFNGLFYSLNGQTGEVLWEQKTRGKINTTPAIAEDGTVYVASVDGTFYAFNGATGQVKWTLSLPGKAGSPEIGKNGTVYMAGKLNPHAAYLYAISPQGEFRWQIRQKGTKEISYDYSNLIIGVSHPTSVFSRYTRNRQ